MALVMWTLSGLVSLLMGLVYCELSQLVPQSGGDLAYINKGLGKIPAFIIVWTNIIWNQTASTAVQALLFSDYFLALMFGSCTPPEYMRKAVAALHIITLGITNVVSVKTGIYVQIISSIIKTVAISVIIIGGFVYLASGHTQHMDKPFEGSATDISSYCLALYSCMYAYSGYVRINEVSEEVQNAKKNIPRAIIISVLVVVVINITANISYFVLIPKLEFLQSNAVAYDWAMRGMASVAGLIPLCVMFSIYGANNGGSFALPRIMFAAAKADLYPEMFSFLHVDRSLPVFGVIVHHFISLLMLAAGDIGKLINFLSFMTFMMMMFSCISLLSLKFRMRGETDDTKFQTHVSIPIIGLVFCMFLIVAPFVSNPPIELLYSVIFVVAGLLLYVPFIYLEIRFPGMDTFTMLTQLLLNVGPTDKLD